MNLFRKMPHQNIGLRTFFLTQVNTVDLSPIENYNFGWGPNFVESPSSLVYMLYDLQQTITCCSDEPLPQDASPEHWPPYVLSDSGQHCVDLSPIENYTFQWGPNFVDTIFFGLHVVRLATDNYITYLENRRYSATIFVPHLLCVWFSERRFGKNHIEDTMSK